MSRVNPAPADGRAFTNYLSAGQYNVMLQTKYGAADNNAYRQFLQRNAEAVKRDSRALKAFQTK